MFLSVSEPGSLSDPLAGFSLIRGAGERAPRGRCMARNTLVINCDIRETRVALIEGGVIAELHIERAAQRGTVGNVVLGKVTRVLPGMQAAFIDVGMDRAAFLHVEDLIRPDDFEAYLSGGIRADEDEPSGKGVGGKRRALARPDLIDDEDLESDDDDDESPDSEQSPDSGDDVEDDDDAEDDDAEDDDVEDDDESDDSDDAEDSDDAAVSDDTTDDAEDSESEPDEAEADDSDESDDDAESEPDDAEGDDSESDETPAEATSEKAEETPAEADTEGDDESDEPSGEEGTSRRVAEGEGGRGRRRRRRRRRGGRDKDAKDTKDKPEPKAKAKAKTKEAPAERGRGRGRRGNDKRRGRGGDKRSSNGNGKSSRVSRSVPITEVVKEGDAVIVQITKEPIGTKGARVSSHVSLPGRYVVYLPTVEHVGISKRIGNSRERSRLRSAIESVKPKMGGLIVRTVAEGLTKKQLKADVGYLIKLWADIARKREDAKTPSVLYSELDIVLKTARDLFTDEIEKIVIDDRDQFARLVRFVEMFLPERVKDIELYSGKEPIFDAYGIEDEIGRALSRKVPLPSGGYLIIDQAEALAAIDVNTGRFVGKGSKDLEETALKTNLEAVDEIAYQLRFRNIGGLVILDLIDMEIAQNRDKVYRALEAQLAKDKAKTTINRISELGLIEMTRKRTRESLSRTMHEPCFYCDGTGQIQSRQTIAYEILRQIRRERDSLAGYSVVVKAHPAIVDLLNT